MGVTEGECRDFQLNLQWWDKRGVFWWQKLGPKNSPCLHFLCPPQLLYFVHFFGRATTERTIALLRSFQSLQFTLQIPQNDPHISPRAKGLLKGRGTLLAQGTSCQPQPISPPPPKLQNGNTASLLYRVVVTRSRLNTLKNYINAGYAPEVLLGSWLA